MEKSLLLAGALGLGIAHAQSVDGLMAEPREVETRIASASAPRTSSALPVLTPAPPYDASDDAARQPTMQELGLSGHVDLAPMRARADRKPRDWRLQALVGQMEHLGGDRAAAEARYQFAVEAAGKNEKRLRHVLWSRGWARLYSGDNEGALIDWRDSAALHGGKPEWYPYTVALAYWRADARPIGMQWFEASELAKADNGQERLPLSDLPMIAQSLIGDMFRVRHLRADSATLRLTGNSLELREPAYIASPPPRYPHGAVSSRKQGLVLSRVCVDARGRVRKTEVEKSSGHPLLDRAAANAIAGWQFRPQVCGGKPRDTWVKVPIEFAVVGAPQGARLPRELSRRADRDTDHAADPTPQCDTNPVGLDPAGYTAVVARCDETVVCTADSVWAPPTCGNPLNTAGGTTK